MTAAMEREGVEEGSTVDRSDATRGTAAATELPMRGFGMRSRNAPDALQQKMRPRRTALESRCKLEWDSTLLWDCGARNNSLLPVGMQQAAF